VASPGELMAAAVQRTGLEDFGDDSFREGMEILVRALGEEARLNARGKDSSITASRFTSRSGYRSRTGTAATPRSTTWPLSRRCSEWACRALDPRHCRSCSRRTRTSDMCAAGKPPSLPATVDCARRRSANPDGRTEGRRG